MYWLKNNNENEVQSCSSLDSIDAFQYHSHTLPKLLVSSITVPFANSTKWMAKNKEFPPSDESIHDRIQSIHRPLILIRRTQVQISHSFASNPFYFLPLYLSPSPTWVRFFTRWTVFVSKFLHANQIGHRVSICNDPNARYAAMVCGIANQSLSLFSFACTLKQCRNGQTIRHCI